MSLLTTPILIEAYRNAVSHDIEWKVDAFWQSYMIQQFPAAEHYAVWCQSAPTPDSRKRVDIAVKRLRAGTILSTLLLCEVKRSGSSKVKDAEKQVVEYAQEYLEDSEERFVYCMTAWGIKARCWIYYKDTQVLTPMFGEKDMGSKASYVDANERRAELISASIAYMKEETTTWPGELESHQSTQSGEGTAADSSTSTQPGYAQASDSGYSEWELDTEQQRYRRYNFSAQEWEWY
ncbi:hypothetical protein FPOAC2_14126 [Fusarium poae]|uniref:Type I restriction enzyme R protein N-terminal domain-containing protein n=1 Tax=Fusarium poae TaxID=36050 RepID=A0A1B8A9M0_FUSPO|nr:uncharacterized protein FPOAC1_013513 [Fusarium poae]KAG8664733.1 hypothetical protein FPOAC1_013513 [Fusarium poae]OBS17177.1 hypothetical protein FPOA_12299 [Fusarium poae]